MTDQQKQTAEELEEEFEEQLAEEELTDEAEETPEEACEEATEEAPAGEEKPAEEDEDLNTKYLRLAADFQNFRRRTEKETFASFNEGSTRQSLRTVSEFGLRFKLPSSLYTPFSSSTMFSYRRTSALSAVFAATQ